MATAAWDTGLAEVVSLDEVDPTPRAYLEKQWGKRRAKVLRDTRELTADYITANRITMVHISPPCDDWTIAGMQR